MRLLPTVARGDLTDRLSRKDAAELIAHLQRIHDLQAAALSEIEAAETDLDRSLASCPLLDDGAHAGAHDATLAILRKPA